MKTKKSLKAKEPIKIRLKALSNGNKSIYLDVYSNGKRSYEFLKLYLIPEVDDASKASNANTMQVANAIKAQRMIELANGKAGIRTAHQRSKMLLVDWIDAYVKQQANKGKRGMNSLVAFKKSLVAYKGDGIRLCDVNKKFCLGYIDFLKNSYVFSKGNKKLSQKSIFNYSGALSIILNGAVKAEIIAENPMSRIDADDKPKAPESHREYLTIDDVNKLIATPMADENVKNAYLFSCCCGLRISDVRALTWGNVVRDGDQCRVEIKMQKTQELLYLPLSSEAQRYLPERGTASDNERIFVLPVMSSIGRYLRGWAEKAGVNKNVTFHTSRHTFATMLLTKGADLYTTSKLLGHTNVSATQIYAKIVNQKKVDAVNLLNDVFNH